MAPTTSSPPLEKPTAPIRPGSMPAIRASSAAAAETSPAPYQPRSIARPSLVPWPRASKSSTPNPSPFSATAWSRAASRVEPDPATMTTPAPLRVGRYQPSRRRPSSVLKCTSRYSTPRSAGVASSRTARGAFVAATGMATT